MSREVGATILITAGANNGSFHRFASFSFGGSWNDAKTFASTSPFSFLNLDAASAGSNQAIMTAEVALGRGTLFAIFRTLLTLDVSSINETTFPNGLGDVYVSLGDANRARMDNLASDHRFCIARASADLQTEINSTGVSFTGDIGDIAKIDGWGGNLVDNSSNIKLYADLDQTVLATYLNGITTSSTSADYLPVVKLNEQAKADILANDFFIFWVLDYDYDVRYRNPATESPSPGASSRASFYYFPLDGGTASGRASYSFSGRSTFFGRDLTSPQPPAPDVIANDFTFNTFADVSNQRGRIFRTIGLPNPNLRPDLIGGKHILQENIDQVPFVLGVKGPLSLRGREFTNEGIPISKTVDPPRAKKDSKD